MFTQKKSVWANVLIFLALVPRSQSETQSLYNITVESKTPPAITYLSMVSKTKIDFRGTVLLPKAWGIATIEPVKGVLKINAQFYDLPTPVKFGGEYLTYVLWAVTPEGRAVNLGEIFLGHRQESEISVTTQLQSFGLVVSAEPYFAVTRLSNVIVMENIARKDTLGKSEEITIRPELLTRGNYTLKSGGDTGESEPNYFETPFYLPQARNAVLIARLEGSEIYASDPFKKSVELLNLAEKYQEEYWKYWDEIDILARQAVQTAEDARLIAKINSSSTPMDAIKKESLSPEADYLGLRTQTESLDVRSRLRESLNLVLETRDSKQGLAVRLPKKIFETGTNSLMPGVRKKMMKVAAILLTVPGLEVEIKGDLGCAGEDNPNQRISLKQLISLKDFLISQGFSPNAVRVMEESQFRLASANTSLAACNIELVISGKIMGEN